MFVQRLCYQFTLRNRVELLFEKKHPWRTV